MTRTPDSNTEKLDALYARRAFLKTKLGLQKETYERTGDAKHKLAVDKTVNELDINEDEIDDCLDKQI